MWRSWSVTYFCLASEKPGFTKNGPLVRFVNQVGEAVLREAKPFTSDAVKGEFRRLRPNVQRIVEELRAQPREDDIFKSMF